MRASKENAAHAAKLLREMAMSPVPHRGDPSKAPEGSGLRFVNDFIEAARRKLPSEAAYKRDRTRVRK